MTDAHAHAHVLITEIKVYVNYILHTPQTQWALPGSAGLVYCDGSAGGLNKSTDWRGRRRNFTTDPVGGVGSACVAGGNGNEGDGGAPFDGIGGGAGDTFGGGRGGGSFSRAGT